VLSRAFSAERQRHKVSTRGGGQDITVYFRTAGIQAKEVAYNDENIFSTKEAAKKELFSRRLRFPQLRGAA